MKYHPLGRRGVALAVAHDRYMPGPTLDKLAAANRWTTLFTQIETRDGVAADAIAAVDGVDCLWVGHFDLSASLGIPGQFQHKDFTDAIRTVIKACRKHGKSAGRLVPTVDEGVAFHQTGFDFICYSGDVWALHGAVQQAVNEIRGRAGRPRAGQPRPGQGTSPGTRTKKRGKEAAMSKFRVALSGDFKKPDGSPAFPDFDLSPLEQNPAVEYQFIKANGVIQASDLEGFDALILLIPRIEPASFPRTAGSRSSPASGSATTPVNVQACTDNGCALAITPTACAGRWRCRSSPSCWRSPASCSPRTDHPAGAEGWAQRNEHMGIGLVGRTLGSLGIGNIGAEVFRLARPFDMKFIAHDPYADPAVPATSACVWSGSSSCSPNRTCCR